MFSNIIEFFKKTEKIRDQRFNDFNTFYTECVKMFPLDLRRRLCECKINPVLPDKKHEKDSGKWTENYIMDFNCKDVIWWREQYTKDKFTFKPIDDIKKIVMKECLAIMESMPLGDEDEELKDFFKSLLDEKIINFVEE